ncbi:hypothetical protein QR680_002933 [Steinernema hermaphroditum]|uniref:Uncharacterized protein n=1 Tax=Steinernema hermaphroditum TaxID=289476 RepID=A0AA39H5L5_9BILA|nr:hypothetical protein QR680_002933 [Steinernema hermaphroditum]
MQKYAHIRALRSNFPFYDGPTKAVRPASEEEDPEMLAKYIVDEKVPNRYRCFYNRLHVVPVCWALALLHTTIFTASVLWHLPQSLYLFPVILLLFISALHGLRIENPRLLFPLQIYLGFLVIADVMFGISVFTVSLMDYDTFLMFIGHVKSDSWAVKVGLVLSTKIVIAMIGFFCYWNYTVIRSCRHYLREQREQRKYVRLAVAPSAPKPNPGYLIVQTE